MAESSEGLVLLSEPAPGVRLLQLNHPKMRNAMTSALTRAWDAAMDSLEADADVRVLVLTGRGSTFSAGADLSWLDAAEESERTPDRIRARMIPFYRSWTRPLTLPFPTIAALNGPTIGAGLALALCCELRYSSRTATFSAPFVHRGTHPGMSITYTLPRAVGMSRAKELFYTGREISADEAVEWGLTLSAHTDVVDHAVSVGARIAAAAPIATRLLKTGLDRAGGEYEQAVEWEALAQPMTLATNDLHEGVRAWRQRREPDFRGE